MNTGKRKGRRARVHGETRTGSLNVMRRLAMVFDFGFGEIQQGADIMNENDDETHVNRVEDHKLGNA